MQRTERLIFRATKNERERIERDAAIHGLTVSDMVRLKLGLEPNGHARRA